MLMKEGFCPSEKRSFEELIRGVEARVIQQVRISFQSIILV